MNIGTACCHRPDCADHECEGRPDPALTRRQQEAELRWQCRDQMDASQFAAHAAAGDFPTVGDRHAGTVGHASPLQLTEQDGGYECALPITFAGDEPEPERWHFPVESKVLLIAIALTWLAVLWLYTADPRDLFAFWPRVLALLSF